MIRLKKLKDLLVSGVLLSKDTFIVNDIDLILDERDIDIFDDEWMRNYDAIKGAIDTPEIKELIESIREISFKITYDSTNSSNLAGYISDDFGLIAEALFLNYNDDWLNALAKEYAENKIPHNMLTPLKGELDNIILK